MNTKRVNAAAGVILAALVGADPSASGIAAALESACLLQSPETATEVEIQSRALSTALAELEELRARVAELEAAQAQQLADAGDWLDEPEQPSFEAKAAAERDPGRRAAWRMLADSRQAEDPHDSDLHHEYALGRELPEVPRA